MDKLDLRAKTLSQSITHQIGLLSAIGIAGSIAAIILSLLFTLSQVDANMSKIKIEAASAFDLFFLKIQSDLLATSEGLAGQNDINSELLTLRTRNNAFLDTLFVSPDGDILVQRNTVGRPKRTTVEESEWLDSPPPFGEVAVGPVRFEGQIPYVDMAVTTTDAIGLPAGILLVRVDLTQLWNKTLDIQVGETGYAYIVDDAGQLVAFRNQRLLETGNNLQSLVRHTPQEIATATFTFYTSLNNQPVMAAAQPLETVPWFAIVEQPISEALAPFMPVGVVLLFVIAIVGFSLRNTIRFIRARIVSPLSSLRDAVGQMENGQLENRVEIHHNDELGQLGEAFNHMAAKIQSQTESLRESEARYRLAITAAGAVPYYRDYQTDSGSYTFMGDGILQLTGYSAAEITPAIFDQLEQECIMRGSLAHLTPDEAGQLSEAGEIQSWICDYRIFTRDGQTRWVSDSAVQIRDENKRRIGVIGILQDITDRKRAEEEIQSLARFPSENPNPVLRLDQDGIVLYANEVSGTVLQKWGCAVGGTAPEFWRNTVAEILASKSSQVIEEEFNQRVYSFSVAPVAKAGYVNLYGMDITERKRAEEDLREREVRYRAISELTSDYTFSALVENDGSVGPNWIAGAFQKITGYSWDEFIEMGSWPKIVHPDDFLADQRDMENLRKNQPIERELRIVTKNGDVRWVQNFVRPVWDNRQGRVTELVGAVRDITERKRVEEALRESEKKYRSLFENMTSGFAVHQMIYDEQGNPYDYRYLEVNPAFEKLTGFPITGMVGKTIRELMPATEDYWIQVSGKVAKTGIPTSYMNFSQSLGKYYDTYLFSPEKDKFAVVFNDVTERVQAENKLKEQLDELRRWHQVTIGRENRIITLKREVNDLLEKAGQPPRYSSTDAE